MSNHSSDWTRQRWQPMDPFRRVRYSLGLVLGVEEFEQEQAYFLGHDQIHARELHGYGTVSGLSVSLKGTAVTVSAGYAVGPRGELVYVPQAQTGDLNQWLATPANHQAVRERLRDGHAMVYINLRPVERETDPVPVLPAPGHDSTPEMVPSRLLDSFQLSFTADPEPSPAESRVRLLGRLLGRVRLSKSHKPITAAEMAALVRALGTEDAAAIADGPGYLFVLPNDADEILETALRVWITEVKPQLPPDPAGQAGAAGVPLAAVRFQLSKEHKAISAHLLEQERPVVLDQRLVRELLLHYQPLGDGEFIETSEVEVRVPSVELVTVTRVSASPRPVYELWFHLSPLAGPFERSPVLADLGNLEVLAEHHSAEQGLVRLSALAQVHGQNLFRVELEPAAAQYHSLRFLFRLGTMRLDSGMLLTDAMRGHPVHWVGQDRYHAVTVFHRQRAEAEVLASGYVTFDGEVSGYNLDVERVEHGLFRVSFPGFTPEVRYMIRATPVGAGLGQHDHVRIEPLDQMPEADGLYVRVHGIDPELPVGGFLVEITRTV